MTTLKLHWLALFALLPLAFAGTTAAQDGVEIDSDLPTYEPVQGVSGSINSVGSDTMNNLMTYWAEGFKKLYPNVRVEIEGKGSSTAPPALIEGTANFGPMSRRMKSSELDKFDNKFGYEPTHLGTSIDMLAVFVNKDNPIESLTLPQVDAIFSKTRKGGYPTDIARWEQIGLRGSYRNAVISMYGRNSASGTYGFFKENALFGGDYKDSVKEQPGSSSVIQGVASDKFGIGYSGIGYRTADVRPVPLATDADSEPIPASVEAASTGKYPLQRFLWLTLNHKPGSQLDPLRREFVKFIYSQQGQKIVAKAGFSPVNAYIARKNLQLIAVEPSF